jgi:hypothetical protein
MADPRDKFKTILTQIDQALRNKGNEDQALFDQVKIVLGIKSKDEHPLYQFMTLKRKFDGSQRGQKLNKKDADLILQLEKIGKIYFKQKQRIEERIKEGKQLEKEKQDGLRAKAEAKPKEIPIAAQPPKVKPLPPPKPKKTASAPTPNFTENELEKTFEKMQKEMEQLEDKPKKSDITEKESREIDEVFAKMQAEMQEKPAQAQSTQKSNKHIEALKGIYNQVVLHMRDQFKHLNREKLKALASQHTTDKDTKHLIHFLFACDDFRREQSKEKWKAIYDHFLSPTAKEPINFERIGLRPETKLQFQHLASQLAPSSQRQIATTLFHEDAPRVLSEKRKTLPVRPLPPKPTATPTPTKEEPSPEPESKPTSTFTRKP